MFGESGFENSLGGSMVSYRKRERPSLSPEEHEAANERLRRLGDGLRFLRKLRTQALEEPDMEIVRSILREAHLFSKELANAILEQSMAIGPEDLDPEFVDTLERATEEYRGEDESSNYSLPPHFSVGNLMRATDDMLARIEEKTKSLEKPDHKLGKDELDYALTEFLKGTNDLAREAREKFFEKGAKIGGVLSGGSVYLEIAKTLTEKYGGLGHDIETFVLAVDQKKDKVVSEIEDKEAKAVLIVDDVINKGGTLIAASRLVGESFPNAHIYTGVQNDSPGGFRERANEVHESHLFGKFQDFADLTEEGKYEDALKIYDEAIRYSKEHSFPLASGWDKIRSRILAKHPQNQ
ncbi:MAG TPA: phosphoribosyltransferase family protein [Candidatus Paceibacterota bacterium]|nr:phosphoribosyltransferase family protein [Candidatus Paceibacterota bacterium]